MSSLILFNKPYGVICQFSAHATHPTLAEWVQVPDVYPAGRLDTDSEGLLLLTADGILQARIADPRFKLPKTYWVQVEGEPTAGQLAALAAGVNLGDFVTLPAEVTVLSAPNVWQRTPPVRFRKTVPDTWLQIVIHEGKNRQVRRMTAKVGLPTLRLIRVAIGPWSLLDAQGQLVLEPGESQDVMLKSTDLVAFPNSKKDAPYGKPRSTKPGPAKRTPNAAAGANQQARGVEAQHNRRDDHRTKGAVPAGRGRNR